MAIKVKAVERNVSFDKNSEKWAYVLQAEMAYGLKAYSLEGTGHHALASPSLLRHGIAQASLILLSLLLRLALRMAQSQPSACEARASRT